MTSVTSFRTTSHSQLPSAASCCASASCASLRRSRSSAAMRMLMSRVKAAAPTIVPASSLIGDIEIETSIRRPSLAIRCVST